MLDMLDIAFSTLPNYLALNPRVWRRTSLDLSPSWTILSFLPCYDVCAVSVSDIIRTLWSHQLSNLVPDAEKA